MRDLALKEASSVESHIIALVCVALATGCGTDRLGADGGRVDAAEGSRSADGEWLADELEEAQGRFAAGAEVLELDLRPGLLVLRRQQSTDLQEVDVDGDGKSELFWKGTPNGREFSVDADHDQHPEELVELRWGLTHPFLATSTHQFDDDGDGSFERRLLYEAAVGSQTARIQKQVASRAGSWTTVSDVEVSVNQAQGGGEPRFSSSGDHTCNAAEQAQIRTAYRAALARGFKCLYRDAPRVAASLFDTLLHHHFIFDCYETLSGELPWFGFWPFGRPTGVASHAQWRSQRPLVAVRLAQGRL